MKRRKKDLQRTVIWLGKDGRTERKKKELRD